MILERGLMMVEKRQRAIQKKVRLDANEHELIMSKVKSSGIRSFQNYARHMLLQGKVINHDYRELIGLRKEVNAIGRNINQVVKYINMSSEVSQEELHLLLNGIDDVKKLVVNFIESERQHHEGEVL